MNSKSDSIQANKQVLGFQHLWECTQRLAKLADTGLWDTTDLSDFITPLLNVSTEGELQCEIRDVIDEIDIMIYIGNQQKEVVKKFKKDVEHLLDADNRWRNETGAVFPKEDSDGGEQERYKDYKWFVINAEELLDDVGDRIAELTGLRQSAVSTSTGVCLPGTCSLRPCFWLLNTHTRFVAR